MVTHNQTAADDILATAEDGREFRLIDYPPDYVAYLDEFHGDATTEIIEQDLHPEECPQGIIARPWNKDVALFRGRIQAARDVGVAEDLGLSNLDGRLWAEGCWNNEAQASQMLDRLHWIADNAPNSTVWWYREDTGDGILLDTYAYKVLFHDEVDDAAFMAAFPGAGA